MKAHDTAITNEIEELGFKIFSVPRSRGDHGGLGVIYKPEINIKLVGKYSSNLARYKTFEYIECVLKTSKGLMRFCNMYRRPYSNKHQFTILQFLSEFEEYLEMLVNKPGIPILLRDFNLHLENTEDTYVKSF